MILFDREHDMPICLEENADMAIQLAAKDLQSNLRQLSGKTSGFAITYCSSGSGME